jgi:hypothetical protein
MFSPLPHVATGRSEALPTIFNSYPSDDSKSVLKAHRVAQNKGGAMDDFLWRHGDLPASKPSVFGPVWGHHGLHENI